MATELGVAYVTVMPSMKGLGKSIAKEFTPAAEKAGSKAGGRLGDGLLKGMKTATSKMASDMTSKLAKSFSGTSVGKAFSSSFDDMALSVGSKMESLGSKVAGIGSKLRTAFAPPGLDSLGAKVSGAFSKVGSTVGGIAGKVAGAFAGVKLAIGDKLGGVAETVKSKFSKLGDAVKPAFDKVGKIASKGFKALATSAAVGAAAASAAFVAIGKSALDQFASFQQLAGGVKKLFGEESAKDVMSYAQNAYMTAGMSANQYMEQATTFSATLIKSLNGDTKEAARLSDVAIRAMSDNINTFGADAKSVQDAWSGFARQNYTMLDNLKLGYAGTRQGMVDLVKDSGVLGDAAADLTTKNLDEKVSFAQMVEAIQAVQVAQGIAGTTAREAGTTIEGSVGMAKAAWANLLTEFGKSDGQIEVRVGELVTSLFGDGTENNLGVFGNVLPVAVNVAKGIVKSLPTAVTSIGTALRTQLMPMLDEVTGGAASRVVSTLEPIATRLGAVFSDFGARMAPLAPVVAEIAGKLAGMLSVAINAALGAFEMLMPVIANIAAAVLPALSAAMDVVIPIVAGVYDAVGRFAGTLMEHLQPAINAVGPILAALGNVILQVGGFIGEHVMPVVGDLAELFAGALGDAISAICEALSDLLDMLSPVGDAIGAVGGAIGDAWNFITGQTEESTAKVEQSVSTHTAAATSAATANTGSLVSGVSLDWDALLASTESAYAGFGSAVDGGTAGAAATAAANVGGLVGDVSGSWDALNAQTGTAFSGVQSNVASSMSAAQSTAQSATSAINNAFGTSFKSSQSSVNSSLSAIRAAVNTQLGGAVSTAKNLGKQMVNALNFRAAANAAVTAFVGLRNGVSSQMSGAARSVSDGVSSIGKAFGNLKSTASAAMSAAIKAVTDGVASMRNALNTHLRMPTFDTVYIRLPHFSMNGTFNSEKGTVPTVSVSWYKRGGIIDGASLIGVGERGRELVVPAENERYMEPFARATARNMGMEEVVAAIDRLYRDLGPIIGRWAPVMTMRDRNRMIRRAMA